MADIYMKQSEILQLIDGDPAQLLPNEVVSEQQSLIVVKKLLAIAVSGITYLRGIFPTRAYGSKYVEDQQVMILKGEDHCPGSSQILQWMSGCFDAIERKYLRTVIMSIYTDPENPQKLTEYYQFRIHYSTGGAQMDFESSSNKQQISAVSCGNIKKASILLVRKLYTLMQNLGPLPENVCLNMKLAYYDDVTPQNYQPPGFREADGDIMEFEREPVKLTMGEVATPFHCVKFDMATEKQRLEEVEESAPVKGKWILKVEDEVIITPSHDPMEMEEPHKESTDLDETEIQKSCQVKSESCKEAKEMDTLVKKTPDRVGLRRTRSGRIISSTLETSLTVNSKRPTAVKDKMVSQYDVRSSQESAASSTAKKKRKFSEPKELY